jgi:hypothetical protein
VTGALGRTSSEANDCWTSLSPDSAGSIANTGVVGLGGSVSPHFREGIVWWESRGIWGMDERWELVAMGRGKQVSEMADGRTAYGCREATRERPSGSEVEGFWSDRMPLKMVIAAQI